MNQSTVFAFDTKPQRKKKRRTPAGMRVTIELSQDGTFNISGESDGERYEGTLVMRQVEAKGGDECWINGVWYSPCPIGGQDSSDD